MKNTNTIPLTKSSAAIVRKPLSEGQKLSFDELYLKKDYKGAAQYLLDNKQRLDSGIFHYNLGTVYSKMGDQATARFHLEKAIQEGYINTSSINNLNFIKTQLQVDDLTNSTSLPDEMINMATLIPEAAYLSITLIFCSIFMTMVRFQKIKRKWVMVLGLLLAASPMIFSQLYVKKINYAIALKDIPLYEGPSKIFNEKGQIRAGSKIILGELKESWFYVKFPLSLSGWINKDQLGLY
jgi:tetratricopeptide (TPR) repeat protein